MKEIGWVPPTTDPQNSYQQYRYYILHKNPDYIQDCFINTLRPRENGRPFTDDIFKRIFLNENCCIFIKISLKFVWKGPNNNIPALVQIMVGLVMTSH